MPVFFKNTNVLILYVLNIFIKKRQDMMLKITVFLLVASVLKLAYDLFRAVFCLVRGKKFESDPMGTAFRWVSLVYVITILITGL